MTMCRSLAGFGSKAAVAAAAMPIATRYPIVEFVTGCLFVSVFAPFGTDLADAWPLDFCVLATDAGAD